ncbi:MAG TPA: hypothetical protein VGL46_09525 [Pseudonocardiaceae bacterium]|jgi:hypothetical protein
MLTAKKTIDWAMMFGALVVGGLTSALSADTANATVVASHPRTQQHQNVPDAGAGVRGKNPARAQAAPFVRRSAISDVEGVRIRTPPPSGTVLAATPRYKQLLVSCASGD